MNYDKLIKSKKSIPVISLTIILCFCLIFGAAMSNVMSSRAVFTAPELGFGWDTGLSAKLDKYGSRYNAKRGQTYGGDTILSNADGGLTNAALVGNGNMGGVFGGTSAGQSLNIGMNDFWNGQYNPNTAAGILPRTVGSLGYNVLSEANTANTDIDLATTYAKVSASSVAEDFSAAAAVSGDYVSNAFWGMGWWSAIGKGKNSWLQLEFNAPITFSRITLWNSGSCRLDGGYNPTTGREDETTNAFKVQVSNDGTTWVDAFEETDNFLPIYDADLAQPATGKYVRLYVTKSVIQGTETARICKFSLFENPKNDLNLMPKVVNGSDSNITVSSNCIPDAGADAPHIYTSSTLYATVCGTQQHLAAYGSWGYGWFTDPEPKNDFITYKLNQRTTFKSYQLWNGSASTANAYGRSDWRHWKVETSKDGINFTTVHTVNKPVDGSQIELGQPAISSFDISPENLVNTTKVSYIRLTIGEKTSDSRALLSQMKIFAGTLEESNIDLTNDTTYIQNIKEGKVGAEASFGGQKYTTSTSMSQTGDNYIVTEFKNNSTEPLAMRYYTSTHLYRNPTYAQSAGVSADKNIIHSTRTTITDVPSRLAWLSAATIAAKIDGEKWENTGTTVGSAYGEFTIPAGGTKKVIAYVDGRQYTEKNQPTGQNYEDIRAVNSPTIKLASDKLTANTADAAKIVADSTAWWKDFWLKSYVDVVDPTVEKFYYNSLYIVGSASRDTNVPSSLFGPFTTSDSMAWGGTYVADYNLYGTYMAVASSNRADLLKPLVRNAMESWGGIEGIGNGIGKDYATKFNGATGNKFTNADGSKMFKNGVDGVLSAVVSGPHGYAANMAGFYGILFTNAYAAIPVLSYFDMTQGTGEISKGKDGESILLTADLEYTYLKDVMDLYEQILIYENGVYKVKYDGAWEAEANNMGNAFSLASVHMFAQRLIDHANRLNLTVEDEPRLLKWKHIDANLEPYPTAMVYDRKNPAHPTRECYSDTLTTAQKNHVTYNGKTGEEGGSNPNVVVAQVIPTDQLGLYSDPAHKQIMRNTLDTIKSWDNINAMPTIFSTAARVGYNSKKYGNNHTQEGFDGGVTTLFDQIKKSTNGGMVQNTVSNLVDPLQLIDTCGAAQGLNDVLVQTFKGITTFFPAYDGKAKFVNLQSKGGFLFSAEQRNDGSVTYAKVTSKFGGKVTYALPADANWDIIDETGAKVVLTKSNVGTLVGFSAYDKINTISFDTQKGKSYYMVPVTEATASTDVETVGETAYVSARKED